MPSVYLETFLDWYILGDGTIDIRYNGAEDTRIYTSSKRMRDDLIEIIIKTGRWASYREDNRQSVMADGRVITPTVPAYQIYLHRANNLELKTRHISKHPYSGKVYCCETPHHTLLVRRNRKMAWCGNSADHHQAFALINRAKDSIHAGMSPNFFRMIYDWQTLAHRNTNGFVGFCSGFIVHHFHGPKGRRLYRERWNILIDDKFDPVTNVTHDAQGLVTLINNPRLLHDCEKYMAHRHEDSIEST
jgi:hypothetical protein